MTNLISKNHSTEEAESGEETNDAPESFQYLNKS